MKGIDRFLGTMDNLEPHLIEVTSGEAKYEHHHRAVVWRMPRLPKEGQGIILLYIQPLHVLINNTGHFFLLRSVHYAQPRMSHDLNVV